MLVHGDKRQLVLVGVESFGLELGSRRHRRREAEAEDMERVPGIGGLPEPGVRLCQRCRRRQRHGWSRAREISTHEH